jgi:hypothetical protein
MKCDVVDVDGFGPSQLYAQDQIFVDGTERKYHSDNMSFVSIFILSFNN